MGGGGVEEEELREEGGGGLVAETWDVDMDWPERGRYRDGSGRDGSALDL